MFAFQEFYKIHSIWRDEIWVDPADLIHHIHTVRVNILVVVPHVFSDLADACRIVTGNKVTRQIKVGRSVTTGL
jgi:hypothetical protein